MNFRGFYIGRQPKDNLKAEKGLLNAFTEIANGKLESPEARSILQAAQKLAKKDPVRFLQSFVQWQHSQYTKEIDHWKSARESALNGYYNHSLELQELYNDIALDAFINGITEKRRVLKISNRPYKLTDSEGMEIADLQKVLNKAWFNKFIKEAMRSKFYGHSLLYFYEWNSNNMPIATKLVPRTHVMPSKDWVSYDISSSNGFYYNTDPYSRYMIGVDGDSGLGDFDKAAILYIIKKHSWSAWDRFEELFGVPLRIAKTASQDKKVLDQIESWMQNMGLANYGLFPQDTEMEVVSNSQTDSFQVFNEKRKACNEELEVLFLGQRRVTLEGGSLAKEQVLQADADEVLEDDKTFIANVINDQLLPLLRLNGAAIPEGCTFTWDDAENLGPLDRLKVYETAKSIGLKIDAEEFAEEFGVNVTEAENTPPEDSNPSPEALAKYTEIHNKIKDLYV